jgi:hypothetical protein
MAKSTSKSAIRRRAWREKRRAERALKAVVAAAQPKKRPKAKAPTTDAEGRKAAARERYRALKEAGGKEYEAMLAAARERAAQFHARRRKAAKKAGARGKKGGVR